MASRLDFCILVFLCILACNPNGLPKASGVTCSKSFSYKDAIGKAILFFEGQRSGKLPSNQRVKWRGNSALSDGQPDNVNLVGGYYDAGDNVKFVWPMSYTITLLSWAVKQYQNDIQSSGELDNLRSAIRWGTDFILKAYSSSNVFYTQVGDGNSDHQCWERPEDMDTPRTLYKVSSSSPGTEPVAEAAAALSAASIVFRNVDSNYSSILLSKSKSLFQLADQHRGSYSLSCPFYCSYSGYQDELLWAAAWIYKASRDNQYLNYITSNQGWSQSMSEFSWDNKFAGAQVLITEDYYGGNKNLQKFKDQIESFVCALMPGSSSVQVKTTLGGLLFTRDSTNLQYTTGATMLLFLYSNMMASAKVSLQCGSAKFSSAQVRSFAKSQVDYILGCNPMGMSCMVGFGSKYPTQLHHRGASIPSISAHPQKVGCQDGFSYYNSNNKNPNIHVGAVVGGPNQNDQYQDKRSDYSHAEPTTYLNAAFVASVAALLGKS